MSRLTTIGLCIVISASAVMAGEIAHDGSCWGCSSAGSQDFWTSLLLGGFLGVGVFLADFGARK